MSTLADRLLVFGCAAVVLLCATLLGCAQESTGPAHDRYMVCYVGTWANYRNFPANFFPEDIDPAQCTHLIYSFVGLDNTTHKVMSLDPWADLDVADGGRGFFRRFTGLKVEYPHLKVLLAIGGYNEDSEKYSVMVSSQTTRAIFIASAVEWTRKYDFDGFDLDWEYPAKRGGVPEDKENFVLLAKELRSALDVHGLLLTAAFGAGIQTMDIAYDFPGLAPHLHMFNIMAYDYHGPFDNITGANSPFYRQDDGWSVIDTLEYMIEKGAPMEKVVLGLPLYGQTFIMDEPQNDGTLELGVPCENVGFPGEYTEADGFMGNQEICLLRTNPSWTRFWDNETGTPFFLNQEKLISYDDEESLELKIEYAISIGLGGLMVWSIDTDDFRGDCFDDNFPTMRHINSVIEKLTTTTLDPDATTTVPTTTTDSSIDWTRPPHPLHMVCYVGTWAFWRLGVAKFASDNIDARLCTHLLYAFAGLHNETFITTVLDKELDLSADEGGKHDYYRNMTALKTKHPHLKVFLAVGGDSEGSINYSEMAASPSKRRVFTISIVSVLRKYNFDGLDLDWEYPGKRGGVPEDRQNFVTLVKDLRMELDKYDLELTVAFGAGVDTMELSYDIPALAPHLDMILIMAYDYHGQWENKTGANAPLDRQDDQWSVTDTLDYLKENDAPMQKVVLGLPVYGHTFLLKDVNSTSMGSPTTGAGFAGELIDQKGFMGYQEIYQCLQDDDWTYYWDTNTSTPYIVNEEKFVSFDDDISTTMKVDYAVRFGVGGLMVWSTETDEFSGTISEVKYPLLKRINNAVKDTLESMRNETTDSPETTETTEDPGVITTTMLPTTTEEAGWTEPPHDLFVVCYVKTWAYFRNEPATFIIGDIDPSLCTHLVYTFAELAKNMTIVAFNPDLDRNPNEGGQGYYMKMTELQKTNPHLKVLLAIGGEDLFLDLFSEMAADSEKRKTFVDSVIRFLLKYEFWGLDLVWQFPGEDDKENYALLVQDLRTAFDRYDFILSIAIPGSPSVMASLYNMAAIRDHVDMIQVMSYDYNTHKDGVTGPNAPLRSVGNSSYTVEDTLNQLVELGAPMYKVVLGIPFYGHTFIVLPEEAEEETSPWGLPVNSTFSGVFVPSAPGFMAYSEICYELTDSFWQRFWDNETETPYAMNRGKLISYDEVRSIELKVNLSLSYHGGFPIAGFSAWSIDTDDFHGDCGSGRYPLLKAISKSIVRSTSTLATDPVSTSTTPMTTTTSRPTTTSVTTTSTTTALPTTTPSNAHRNTLSVAFFGLIYTIVAFYILL